MERPRFRREFKLEVVKLVKDRRVAVLQASQYLDEYHATAQMGEGGVFRLQVPICRPRNWGHLRSMAQCRIYQALEFAGTPDTEPNCELGRETLLGSLKNTAKVALD
jgi:hypothetical protein